MEVVEEPTGEHGEGSGRRGRDSGDSPAEICDSVIDLSDAVMNRRQAREGIHSFYFFSSFVAAGQSLWKCRK